MTIPDKPYGNKPVIALTFGDVVNAQGDHVVEVDKNSGGRNVTIYLSNGSSMSLPKDGGELPFYGNINRFAREG